MRCKPRDFILFCVCVCGFQAPISCLWLSKKVSETNDYPTTTIERPTYLSTGSAHNHNFSFPLISDDSNAKIENAGINFLLFL